MQHRDMMSSHRHGWRILTRLAALSPSPSRSSPPAASPPPAASATSAASASATPTASAAADTCAAQILKSGEVRRRSTRRTTSTRTRRSRAPRSTARSSSRPSASSRSTCTRAVRAHRRPRSRSATSTRRSSRRARRRSGSASASPGPSPSRVPIYKTVKKTVSVKKGNRIVKVKKKVKVYTYEKCKRPAPTARRARRSRSRCCPARSPRWTSAPSSAPGADHRRPVGLHPRRLQAQPGQPDHLTRGSTWHSAPPTSSSTTTATAARSRRRSGRHPDQNVYLDPTRQSISTLTAAGGVTATATRRSSCRWSCATTTTAATSPYITTGYRIPQTFFLKGKLEKGLGLTKLHLTSAPDPLDVQACLSPGSPTSPCNNSALIIPLPIIVSTSCT